jgi:hypothetical protein
MKRLLIITLGLVLCTSVAFGQAGGIGLYVDQPTYTDCDYDDTGAALVPVYAVHLYSIPGATASQWLLVEGGGFNCSYTGEIVHMPTVIGATRTGISLGYGGCIAPPTLLVTINYFCMGTSPACASLEIVGDPASGSGLIEVVDCAFTRKFGVGSMMFFNDDGTCGRPCGIATKEVNWGRMKALYE